MGPYYKIPLPLSTMISEAGDSLLRRFGEHSSRSSYLLVAEFALTLSWVSQGSSFNSCYMAWSGNNFHIHFVATSYCMSVSCQKACCALIFSLSQQRALLSPNLINTFSLFGIPRASVTIPAPKGFCDILVFFWKKTTQSKPLNKRVGDWLLHTEVIKKRCGECFVLTLCNLNLFALLHCRKILISSWERGLLRVGQQGAPWQYRGPGFLIALRVRPVN